jgi:diamine N-acetyltransferase
MNNSNYEIKNKGLHLVNADRENFWALMDLRVAKEQEKFVASNAISLAQAYDTIANGKFVQPFGIWDGDIPVGFAMIGHNSESTKRWLKSIDIAIAFVVA